MIVGRSRETILRGGFQIHPHAVESRLQARPAVDDVCAIGLPHDTLGELVSVSIVPVEGAVIGEEIDDLSRETMADDTIPDLARCPDALPITASGPQRRRELERRIAPETTAMTGT